jgi:hypothetical protein
LTTVPNILWLLNTLNGTFYFISVVTLDTFVLPIATSTPTTMKGEGIVAFPWQQLLRNGAKIVTLYTERTKRQAILVLRELLVKEITVNIRALQIPCCFLWLCKRKEESNHLLSQSVNEETTAGS